MPIHTLHIRQFRNLSQIDCEFHPHFNLILGPNGSGKTSLLEAVYYLSRARSFRSNHNSRIVQHNTSQFLLQTRFDNHKLGIQRQLSPKDLQIRLDEQDVRSTAQLAQHLPVLLIYYDSFQLVSGQPEHRRRFIDWGVFHVEHVFADHWRQYTRVLKQRNLALKNQQSASLVQGWDPFLVQYGQCIAQARQQYIDKLQPYINNMLQQINIDWTVEIAYQPGIPAEYEDLQTAIHNNLQADFRLGYTQYGPHRGDLRLTVDGKPAKEVLSRGQQKALILALYLAQSQLFVDSTGHYPILLIDDLVAEFDPMRLKQALSLLHQQAAQLFITAIDSQTLPMSAITDDYTQLHIQAGQIQTTDSS